MFNREHGGEAEGAAVWPVQPGSVGGRGRQCDGSPPGKEPECLGCLAESERLIHFTFESGVVHYVFGVELTMLAFS